MEEQTDATGFGRGMSMPLALQTLEAVTTVADAGTVEHAQAAIRFPALLGGPQCLACRAAQYPIGLVREVLPREASRFPG